MQKKSLSLVILASLMLSACATQTGWTPTVDTYKNTKATRLNQDMAECQQMAKHASGGTVKETAVGAGVGGVLGAAFGAAVGAAFGDAGTGAAAGAATGGIGGATHQGLQSENKYKHAYSNCLRQRGHTVVN